MQHVFIVGAKSLGAYGGYETFLYKLTEYHQYNQQIQYHIACKANGDAAMDESVLVGLERISETEFRYHNARCFKVSVPKIGPAQAIWYDVASLQACCDYIRAHNIPHPIVYVLACRIGPFMGYLARKIRKLGGQVFVNPDGHEWKRAKWPAPVRKYWKISEGMMTKHADRMICDSKNIEKYIRESYRRYAPETTYIAYGAETRRSKLADDDEKLLAWYGEKGLQAGAYYLVVGRFVPENNYETMIREFMKSKTEKAFAIITNVNEKFLEDLEQKLHFRADPRIRFVGTVYDQELLMKIRQDAYGYFHGHEVGGTNPSLLEALGSTELNLLLDVGFNREVAEESALYWSKAEGDLAALIERADRMPAEERAAMGRKAKERIGTAYSWQFIADEYEKLFLGK